MRLSLSLSFCIGTIVVFGIFFLMSMAWRYKASKIVSFFSLGVLFLAALLLVVISYYGSFFDLLLGLVVLAPAMYFSREGMLRLQFLNNNKLLYRGWWREILVIPDRLPAVYSVLVAIFFIALSAIFAILLRFMGVWPGSGILVAYLPSVGAFICFFLLVKNKKIKKLARLA